MSSNQNPGYLLYIRDDISYPVILGIFFNSHCNGMSYGESNFSNDGIVESWSLKIMGILAGPPPPKLPLLRDKALLRVY